MRIFLVIDETNFYQPNFVADLIKEGSHEFVGCALVTKIPARNSLENYMLKNYTYLTLPEIAKLVLKKLKYKTFDLVKITQPDTFYSVKSVLEYYNIPYFEVKDDINKPFYLQKIEGYRPELLLSSNSLYFKKKLLNIAPYCINRHSSLLPSYGGLWPIFQALKNNEGYVGVSVHLMESKIDHGEVIAQIKIKVSKNDTVDILYQKCFAISAQVCFNAIQHLHLKANKRIFLDSTKDNSKDSYFSFPTKDDWVKFRKNQHRFI